MIGWVALLIFIDSVAGFMTGFGTSMLLVPILLFWYPIHTVLILVGLMNLLNNLNKVLFFFKRVPWRLLFIFGIPAVIMSFVGAELTFFVDRTLFLRLLGILLFIYVFMKVFYKELIFPKNTSASLVGGGLYGFLEGLTGIAGALRVALFTAYNMGPAEFIATNGLLALIVDIARVGTYASHGMPPEFVWWHYLLFFAMTVAGAFGGKFLINKLPVIWIRRIVLAAVFLVSLKFIIYP